MLTFFSDPYPDELLYSAFARYHINVGNIDLLDTLEELFGKRTIVPNIYLGSNLDYLCDELGGQYNSNELIDNHTIFPFYKFFLPSDRQIEIINNMKFGNCEGIYASLGFSSGGICKKGGIQYCIECVQSDIKKYGEPYIHREHQLQGILVCPHHGTILSTYKSNIKNSINSRLEYIRFTEVELNNESGRNDIDETIIENYDQLNKLSRMAYKLLSCNFSNIDRNDVLNSYRNLLYEKGFMSINERIHHNDLYHEFLSFYGHDFLNLLECNIDKNYDYNWLKVITRRSKRTSHPIRHLLLINFLIGDVDLFFSQLHKKYNPFGQGPWPCLNKAADHYFEDVINNVTITTDSKTIMPVGTFKCSCGYIYARKGPDKTPEDRYKVGKTKAYGYIWTEKLTKLLEERTYSSRQLAEIMGCDPNTIRKKASELNMNYFSSNNKINIDGNKQSNNEDENKLKLEAYKKKVLDTIESNKFLGKIKIRSLISNEYRYMLKHDKEWLDDVLFNCYNGNCNNSKSNAKIDWFERDNTYLELVSEKCKEIYNRIPYKRVSKTLVFSELGLLNMLYNNADKIPKTIQFIQENQESVKQFRIRKCNNIIEKFEEEDKSLQLWRIQKMAAISASEFNEIISKLNI